MAIQRIARHEADAHLDYGFRPMRNVRWYKRLQAWALSGTNRRYEAMVAEEKRALLSPLSGTVLEIGPGGGNNLAFLSTVPRRVRWIGVEPNPFFHDRLRARGERLGIDVDVRAATGRRCPPPIIQSTPSSRRWCSARCAIRRRCCARCAACSAPEAASCSSSTSPRRTGPGCAACSARCSPVWGALSDGCHPDRDTGRLIDAAGFADVDLRPFRLPVLIMGPHVAGVARV